MTIQLISASDTWRHTDIERNVYLEKLEPRIIRAQEKYLLPVLGPRLYELVCEAYKAEAASPSVPMPTRLDELHTAFEPMVQQWLFFLSLPFLNTSTTNRAIESAPEALQGPEYRTYAASVKTEAEDRTADLQKWLAARADIYPEASITPPRRRRTGGIVL